MTLTKLLKNKLLHLISLQNISQAPTVYQLFQTSLSHPELIFLFLHSAGYGRYAGGLVPGAGAGGLKPGKTG